MPQPTTTPWPHYCETATTPIRFEDRPLPWQVAGLQETASGYGKRLTSRQVAILPDGRARRVYVTQYSNAGTAWITVDGQIVTVSDCCAR